MAIGALDWSQCPAVESVPGRVGGAWVLRDTRMPIFVILENLEYGAGIEEIIENYRVTRKQIQTVLDFAARSAAPPVIPGDAARSDVRPLDKSAPNGLIRHLAEPSHSQDRPCSLRQLAVADRAAAHPGHRRSGKCGDSGQLPRSCNSATPQEAVWQPMMKAAANHNDGADTPRHITMTHNGLAPEARACRPSGQQPG